ncbi:MAG: RNA polymerase sigma factor [Planctomycetota bacterium]
MPIADLLIHAEFVRGLARDLVRDVDGGDDLAQEVWLQSPRRPPRLGGSLRGWLATTAAHLLANRRRAERRRRARESAIGELRTADAAADIVGREQVRERMLAAVLCLDEPFRTAVLLRYYEGLEPRQIAARLAVPGRSRSPGSRMMHPR